jgi:hypothetical protein
MPCYFLGGIFHVEVIFGLKDFCSVIRVTDASASAMGLCDISLEKAISADRPYEI